MVRWIALLAALAAMMPAAAATAAERQNWTALVTVEDDGTHVLGNPDADLKLTEFVSYTCSHCATFQMESDAPIRLAYVMPGKLSLKVQNVIRNQIDLTVAMLTNCGDPAGFFKRHHIFLYGQRKWLSKNDSMSEAQRLRWRSGPMPARLRAVASDFDFYEIMSRSGYSITDVDLCLTDRKMAKKLTNQTAATATLGVRGTPSFALNGTLLDSIHDWKSLDIAIKAHQNPISGVEVAQNSP